MGMEFPPVPLYIMFGVTVTMLALKVARVLSTVGGIQ